MTLLVELFWTFLKIGLFTFGGGYAMVALIEDEVCTRYGWLTPEEFTDILAVSQATPGPIGINAATYTGYTAMVNGGYDPWLGVAGALVASGAVVLLPVLLMVLAVRLLGRVQGKKEVEGLFRVLRLAVVGLIAAAALQLVGVESFGQPGLSLRFLLSVGIFVVVFVLSMKKVSPVWLILAAGAAGVVAYSIW